MAIGPVKLVVVAGRSSDVLSLPIAIQARLCDYD